MHPMYNKENSIPLQTTADFFWGGADHVFPLCAKHFSLCTKFLINMLENKKKKQNFNSIAFLKIFWGPENRSYFTNRSR